MLSEPDRVKLTAAQYLSEGLALRTLLPQLSEEELREYCGSKADQFAKALFDRGAYTAEGAKAEGSPLANPAPGLLVDVLDGILAKEHVDGMVTLYHRAQQGDVRQELAAVAEWLVGVAGALLSGAKLPPCVYCGGDHSPRL